MSNNNNQINKEIKMSSKSELTKETERLIGWGGRADEERIVEVLGDNFVTPVEGLTITRYELGVLLNHYWDAHEALSVMNLSEKSKLLDRNLVCLNNHAILRLMEIEELLGPVECSDMIEIAESKRDQILKIFEKRE